MEEPREAIFITEVLQDGRATHIMVMLTGSLILATAVFSLLAGQAWARSRSHARLLPPGQVWTAESDWQASDGVRVGESGSLDFGTRGGWLRVRFGHPRSSTNMAISVADSGFDWSRLTVQLWDQAGQELTLTTADEGIQLWLGDTGQRDLMAWAAGPDDRPPVSSLEIDWEAGVLKITEGDVLRIHHPGLPFGDAARLDVSVDRGRSVQANLSIR